MRLNVRKMNGDMKFLLQASAMQASQFRNVSYAIPDYLIVLTDATKSDTLRK